jgi:heparosan-N-sulfate-glucuronate 5-epimerase
MTRRLSTLRRRLPHFARCFWRDATDPLRYAAETEDVHGTRLGRYYFLFDEGELKRGGSRDFYFDAQGIPVVPTQIQVEPPRMHYCPVAIGQYALAIFHGWLSSAREDDRRRFLRLADWFVEHQAEDGCWYVHADVVIYRLRAPWPSAMAQGRGLSVLARAWQDTGEERYIKAARRALDAFTRPLDQGGVTGSHEGLITYEEYPAQPPPHVLNGSIFALFGLWDMARVLPGDGRAATLFERGAATVEALLPQYDTGWWSLCDLYHLKAGFPRNPCTAHYHDIHIKQLKVLHAITGRESFATVAQRWAAYQQAARARLRAYAGKAVVIARRQFA